LGAALQTNASYTQKLHFCITNDSASLAYVNRQASHQNWGQLGQASFEGHTAGKQ